MVRSPAFCVVIALAAACGSDPSDGRGAADSGITFGSNTAPSSATEGSDNGESEGEVDSMSSGTGTGSGPSSATNPSGPVFDLGNPTTGVDPDGEVDEGCDKVDVVFAVDNSGSMSEEHDALRGPVFDAFPTALLDINNGIEDFQLGVIDACPKPALFHNQGNGGACNFSTGANFMRSDSPSLAAEFACVTDFSNNGFNGQPDACIDDGAFGDDDEQPALTAAETVSAENLAGSNAGFLREDAILFVVAITDEDEELADVDSAQDIYDRIVAAKGGDVSEVVYLGIAGGSVCNGPYGTALNAVVSQQVTQLFVDQGQGMFWDLCDGNLETAFDMAISTLVDQTCQDFIPPEG